MYIRGLCGEKGLLIGSWGSYLWCLCFTRDTGFWDTLGHDGLGFVSVSAESGDDDQ